MDTQTITVCAICTENLASPPPEGNGNDVAAIVAIVAALSPQVVTTTCGHLFHGKCFSNWTKSTSERPIPSCPNCRRGTSGQPVVPIFPSFQQNPVQEPRTKEIRIRQTKISKAPIRSLAQTLGIIQPGRQNPPNWDEMNRETRNRKIQALEELYATGGNRSQAKDLHKVIKPETPSYLQYQMRKMDLIQHVSWLQLDSIPPSLPKSNLPKCLRMCLGVPEPRVKFFQHVHVKMWNLVGHPKPADSTTEEKVKVATILQNAIGCISQSGEFDGPLGLKELGFRCFKGDNQFGFLPYVDELPNGIGGWYTSCYGTKPGELKSLVWFNDEAHLTIVGLSREGGVAAGQNVANMHSAIKRHLPWDAPKIESDEERHVMFGRFTNGGPGTSVESIWEEVKDLGVDVRIPFLHLPNVLELWTDSLKTTDGKCGDLKEAITRIATGMTNSEN